MKPSVSRQVLAHRRCHDVRSYRGVFVVRRVCRILFNCAAAILVATAAPALPAESASESLLALAPIDPGTPGYQQLGAGYDVFTAYADAEFVRNPVLDLAALNEAGKLGQFPVDKFTVNQFTLDFKADEKEEHCHPKVVDPGYQRLGQHQPVPADAHFARQIHECFVPCRQRRVTDR